MELHLVEVSDHRLQEQDLQQPDLLPKNKVDSVVPLKSRDWLGGGTS